MKKKNNYLSAISTGVFGTLFIIIILLGGFIFPLLYIFCDIVWLDIVCIIYAAIYALASILGGNLIPYLTIYFINLFILKFQGNDNYWLLSFIEVPLLVSIYSLIAGFFKRKKEKNHDII